MQYGLYLHVSELFYLPSGLRQGPWERDSGHLATNAEQTPGYQTTLLSRAHLQTLCGPVEKIQYCSSVSGQFPWPSSCVQNFFIH